MKGDIYILADNLIDSRVPAMGKVRHRHWFWVASDERLAAAQGFALAFRATSGHGRPPGTRVRQLERVLTLRQRSGDPGTSIVKFSNLVVVDHVRARPDASAANVHEFASAAREHLGYLTWNDKSGCEAIDAHPIKWRSERIHPQADRVDRGDIVVVDGRRYLALSSSQITRRHLYGVVCVAPLRPLEAREHSLAVEVPETGSYVAVEALQTLELAAGIHEVSVHRNGAAQESAKAAYELLTSLGLIDLPGAAAPTEGEVLLDYLRWSAQGFDARDNTPAGDEGHPPAPAPGKLVRPRREHGFVGSGAEAREQSYHETIVLGLSPLHVEIWTRMNDWRLRVSTSDGRVKSIDSIAVFNDRGDVVLFEESVDLHDWFAEVDVTPFLRGGSLEFAITAHGATWCRRLVLDVVAQAS